MMLRAEAMRTWTTAKAMIIATMLLLVVLAFFISSATENNDTLVRYIVAEGGTHTHVCERSIPSHVQRSHTHTHRVLVSTLYMSLVDFKQPPWTREPSASAPVVETTTSRAEH
jgi:ABC-type nickel/cobalt efflux system permease component RcnA